MQVLTAKRNTCTFHACSSLRRTPYARCLQRNLPRSLTTRSRYTCGVVKAAENAACGPTEAIKAHISALLGAVVAINALSPLVYAVPAIAATVSENDAPSEQQTQTKPAVTVTNAPSIHAEATEAPAEPNQWWQHDAAVWTELTSTTELTSYISSSQPPPAWPALVNNPIPKLKLIEFYATWCPACKAAAPGMAAAAGDAELQQHCSFARVNVDRVKPLMKQLGVSRIPTVMLVAPDGRVLDTFRASGQVARDAILAQAAALQQAAAEAQPSEPGITPKVIPEITPEKQGEELIPLDGNGNGGSSSSGSAAGDQSSSAAADGSTGSTSGSATTQAVSSTDYGKSKAACSITPEPSCTEPTTATTSSSNGSSSSSSSVHGLAAAKQQFLAQYGSSYGYKGWLDAHFHQELGTRLGEGHHYMDYTGAALYPASLLQAVYQDLLSHTYGNPHSAAAAAAPGLTSSEAPAAAAAGNTSTSIVSSSSSSTSTSFARSSSSSNGGVSHRVVPAAASELVMEQAALAVLEHMRADPAEYQVIFTRSATEALKLVGEMFPWSPGSSSSSSGVPTSDLQMLGGHLTLGQQQQHHGVGAPGSSSSSSSNGSSSKFVYTRSNHNSVLGIGAYAAAAGAELVPLSDDQFDAWVAGQQQQQQQQQQQDASQIGSSSSSSSKWQLPWGLQQAVQQAVQQSDDTTGATDAAASTTQSQQQQQQQQRYHLLAYPAQDNFAGVIYPLDYVNQAHAANTATDRYVVLLDAAAYLPTHSLDLASYPADFVVASFYKMFGYPTGLGALVLRTELVPELRKVYFGGGSVSLATPEGCWHVAKCDPGAALTDGTPNYLGAAALKLAYDSWDSRGGVQAVEAHTQAISSWLHNQLTSLQHSNGAPLLNIYGKHQQQYGGSSSSSGGGGGVASAAFGNNQPVLQQQGAAPVGSKQQQTLDQIRSLQQQQQPLVQGSIFNFQVLQPDGKPLSYLRVESDAAAAGIDLRSGCVCNPGACYDALGLTADEVQGLVGLKEGCGDDMDFITVMRPVETDGEAGVAAAGNGRGAHGSSSSSSSNAQQQQQQQQQLVEKQIPLGSVRASLGWASTFEDAYALVQFLKGYVQ